MLNRDEVWCTMSMATIDIDSDIGPTRRRLQYRPSTRVRSSRWCWASSRFSCVITAANSFEWCLLVAPIPASALFVALRSLATIRRHPDQYTGEVLAQLGLVLSLVFLIGGVSVRRLCVCHRSAGRLHADFVQHDEARRDSGAGRRGRAAGYCVARRAKRFSSRAIFGPIRSPCRAASIGFCWCATTTSAASATCRRSNTTIRST